MSKEPDQQVESELPQKTENSAVSSTKRIAKNTIMLYFRQILIMLVSLYTVRVVLNVLGAEDYGIYNVVGGIVAFFSFLSGTMASATQRFFSYAIGENDSIKLQKTFYTNFIIYFFIIIISVVFLETLGTWFVYKKLNIPADRFSAACWIFHFSILTFVFTLIASPFMAIIIAHEDMHIYAYVSIAEAILKLGAVFLLTFIAWDKLKLYSILLCLIGFVYMITYVIICMVKYDECKIRKTELDKELLKETFDYTGWTLFGQISSVARTQAVTVLINQVFTPGVVAARTLATQVSNYVNVFSLNFNTGLYPPIVKAYASDNKPEMFRLVFTGCKITFFLMWIFFLPLFFKMEFVLSLWLKNIPEWTVLFTQLALIEVLLNSVSLPIMTAARAFGKMKKYELSLGAVQILIFIVDFILLYLFKMPPYVVFIVAAIANLLMFIIRLVVVHGMIEFPILEFNKKIIFPISLVMISSTIFAYGISLLIPKNFWGNIFFIFIAMCLSLVFMGFFGFNKLEKRVVLNKLLNKFKR